MWMGKIGVGLACLAGAMALMGSTPEAAFISDAHAIGTGRPRCNHQKCDFFQNEFDCIQLLQDYNFHCTKFFMFSGQADEKTYCYEDPCK